MSSLIPAIAPELAGVETALLPESQCPSYARSSSIANVQRETGKGRESRLEMVSKTLRAALKEAQATTRSFTSLKSFQADPLELATDRHPSYATPAAWIRASQPSLSGSDPTRTAASAFNPQLEPYMDFVAYTESDSVSKESAASNPFEEVSPCNSPYVASDEIAVRTPTSLINLGESRQFLSECFTFTLAAEDELRDHEQTERRWSRRMLGDFNLSAISENGTGAEHCLEDLAVRDEWADKQALLSSSDKGVSDGQGMSESSTFERWMKELFEQAHF